MSEQSLNPKVVEFHRAGSPSPPRIDWFRILVWTAGVAFSLTVWWWLLRLAFHASAVLGLTPNRVVEAPPSIYASGPTQTGHTHEMFLPSVQAVDALCQTGLGGLPEHARKGAYYMGCYLPQIDYVVIMDPAVWPSNKEWKELRAHEWAHARGWRHNPDGHGTDWARSLAPVGAQLQQAGNGAPATATNPQPQSAATITSGQ